MILRKLSYLIRSYPDRIDRMGKHFVSWFYGKLNFRFFFSWFMEFWFYFIDLLGIPEIYEVLSILFKWNTRPLNDEEFRIAKEIFGDVLDYDAISIDDRAFIGPGQFHFAYVGFHTINHFRSMGPALLIHELVHVLQYEREGSVYIPRALKAQRSKEGYSYGGVNRIIQMNIDGVMLGSLNYEQQAEVFKDYYRIKNAEPHSKAREYLPFYKKIVQEYLRLFPGVEQETRHRDTKP